ncbi:N-acetylglucosamine kinase-like BadF-type ATPase [Hydrogenispora ethanolica]|uniref:N-acetylglucosamine kinase-like BadF-type ATPase n=1 Tax=Hydrogenispora ethanolica TaxID=1082276 RepID=A0A4R1RUM5_HYDET|nr:BadF/BadG/BcrA/BcrD ATPase family protein [Hydrogenispora ethanolica]TCL70084.1 N-acetylglucosamine kinase-like BadF-type ATPase [Hydrogenispora ethanolica]
MARFVLGVDGGTTKTHCALFDTDGERIDFLPFGPTNHERLAGSFNELEEKLRELVREILGRNQLAIADLAASVFGLSGVDARFQREKIAQILRNIGFSRFILCNDAYLGVKAGSRSGMGIGVINGTGCSVCGIDPAGRMLQLNGQGEITGEPGGGGYLGSRATQAAYNFLFRGGPATRITDLLWQRLGIRSKFDLIDCLREKLEYGGLRLADLAPVIFQAANYGDRVALAILETMGTEIAASVNGVVRELAFAPDQPLEIVLAGSIAVKGENPAALNRLQREVRAAQPGRVLNFIVLNQSPVAGAVVWALQEVRRDNALYDKVVAQL